MEAIFILALLIGMRSKKFRFKKRHLQTRFNGVVSLVMLGLALLLFFTLDLELPLQIMAIVALIALVAGSRADNRKNGYFYVDNDELVLKNMTSRRRLGLRLINDVSIVDPGAARRYIAGRIMDSDNTLSSTKRKNIFTQFCTVELGLSGGFIGKFLRVIQGTVSAKSNDLVLLRMQDGTDLLISPIHANDAVSYLNRMIESLKNKDRESQKELFDTKNAASS